MKKYRLIKEYPSSPKLNNIIEFEKKLGDVLINWDTMLEICPKIHFEFWQEVIEKDYEILSFKDTIGNLITKKEGKFLTSFHDTEYKEEGLIKRCKIHSVKRLSDGEVFTVGDNVKIAGQSGVSKNIKDNQVLQGSPAFSYKEYMRSYASFKNLPSLVSRINELEKLMK